jgi:hypothetical protein
MVRRNAALALAAHRDAAARPELLAMLQPHRVPSPLGGRLKYRLEAGNYVNPGTLVLRINDDEVRASLPGRISALLQPEGAAVKAGDPLYEIAADENHAWEALRAFYLVGQPEDAPKIRDFARRAAGMHEKVRQQADLTLRHIESAMADQHRP